MKLMFSLIATVVGSTLNFNAFAGIKVTAEKKCRVRIEGESVSVGDKYVVIKTNESGKRKKVAIVLIKKSIGQKAVGTVTAGVKNCGTLLGSDVEPLHAHQPSSRRKLDLMKLEGSVSGAYVSFSTAGVHQSPGLAVPALQLWALGVNAEAYPLMFANNSFLSRGLGFAVTFDAASPVRTIDVNASDGDPNKAGKQDTMAQFLQADAVFRLAFAAGKATTELHPIGFFQKTLVHKLSGGNSALARSPLRNISYQGFMIGARQRYFVNPKVRLSAAGFFGLGVSGAVDDTTEATKDAELLKQTTKAESPTVYSAELAGDFFLQTLKVTGGAKVSSYSSSILLQTQEKHKVTEIYSQFFVGVGFSL